MFTYATKIATVNDVTHLVTGSISSTTAYNTASSLNSIDKIKPSKGMYVRLIM